LACFIHRFCTGYPIHHKIDPVDKSIHQHSRLDSLKHGLHHAYVALVLAAIILIAEQHGWLIWLDSISLRAATALTPVVNAVQGDPSAKRERDEPVVLLVSDEMYEKDFRQISPLSRSLLADTLIRILEKKPESLAIDLDLSPGPGDEDDPGQRRLDDILIKAARSGTRLILGVPFPVQSDKLLAEKARWMQRLCASGISFGFTYIQTSQGLVLRYPTGTGSLGDLLAGTSSLPVATTPCAIIESGEQSAAFLSKDFPGGLFVGGEDLSRQRPLNTAYFRGRAPVWMVGAEDVRAADLSGRMVVLGAGFNPNDEFLTAYGPQKGASIHAAIAFSERQPTKAVSHAMAILLDIVLGIAAGFLFHAIWGRYHLADERAMESGYWPIQRFLVARLWLFASFTILVVWIAMLMAMSAWLLRHNLWNNPGPMIIGVFVKTILASRSHGEHHETSQKAPAVMKYADELLCLPIVAWGIVAFFSSH
jgi:hypothetical protein